ncbi:MAG: bifunctional DNA-formamidopyrimidine glycosylase/DNA-(apurinic or apyrimidinic site) lyase [Anaerolineae bacterium]|nr:bifunctional DNA-formamidopyrimidine glycosylase/DNA-(apurinic or apyrimidinic site) lyase [Anaerolineae bacterium]MDW8100662.1 bifunctional DNA-formamidopyrimidine glycosylase/DNA-(apurinic or apyrimidinic site) lyase [Anaerolineae bacterium]
MPELPEVEIYARELRAYLVGRRITDVAIWWPGAIVAPSAEVFPSAARGQQIINVTRRGKYLLMPLASGASLVIHLRMTGNLSVRPAHYPIERHTHVVLWLDDGQALHFNDPRKFGRLWLVDDAEELVGKLGPEPLDGAFTPQELAARLRGRTASIKAALLDQTCIAGIGNIYADEALFAARIDPRRPANSLDYGNVLRLHAAIRSVLAEAIRAGGSTLRNYRPPMTGQGHFQEKFQVVRRADQPCPACGTPIVRIRLAQRSTYFCPQCQR